jgi:DNA-binding NtrC family response regulator
MEKLMKTVKVIVIDDELGIREGVRRVLSRIKGSFNGIDYSFNITACETGEEGIENMERDDFDICLLDNNLPGINGTEVLDHIGKKMEKKPRTIVITAFASVETADSALRNGAFGFLGKPFKPDELKESVEKAVADILG